MRGDSVRAKRQSAFVLRRATASASSDSPRLGKNERRGKSGREHFFRIEHQQLLARLRIVILRQGEKVEYLFGPPFRIGNGGLRPALRALPRLAGRALRCGEPGPTRPAMNFDAHGHPPPSEIYVGRPGADYTPGSQGFVGWTSGPSGRRGRFVGWTSGPSGRRGRFVGWTSGPSGRRGRFVGWTPGPPAGRKAGEKPKELHPRTSGPSRWLFLPRFLVNPQHGKRDFQRRGPKNAEALLLCVLRFSALSPTVAAGGRG